MKFRSICIRQHRRPCQTPERTAPTAEAALARVNPSRRLAAPQTYCTSYAVSTPCRSPRVDPYTSLFYNVQCPLPIASTRGAGRGPDSLVHVVDRTASS